MCYDVDARPPFPPIRGAAADAGQLTLSSADGTQVPAYSARAERPGGPGIVVLPDVRGLHPFFEELALRFAEGGIHATAIDYYARTGDPWPRAADWDFGPHVSRLRHATLNSDVAAAVAHLRSAQGGAAERIYTIGFCIGGRISSLQAAAGHGLSGVITFYGPPVGEHRAGLPAPVDEAERFTCPVLAIYGGADRGIPADDVAAYDRALDAAEIERRTVVYPGAPHSFFDRTASEHAQASDDAWRQVMDFIGPGD